MKISNLSGLEELQKAMRVDFVFRRDPINGWFSVGSIFIEEPWHNKLWWFYNNSVRVAGMVNIKLKWTIYSK